MAYATGSRFKMMYLQDRFRFEAPLSTVTEYLLGSLERYSRFLQSPDPLNPVYGYLWIGHSAIPAEYGGMIVFAGDGHDGERRWFEREVLRFSKIGPVALEALEPWPGESIINLYLHSDPELWALLLGDGDRHRERGEPFVLSWWDEVVEGWLDRTSKSVARRGRAARSAAPTRRKKVDTFKEEEIERHRKIVQKASRMLKEDPDKTWKEIAAELHIPERTLRDWRRNPDYR